MFADIITDRLILKGVSMDDREFMLSEFSNDTVNEFLFDQEPMASLEEADELIEFYNEPEPRNQHRWILVLKDTGVRIGTCGYHCWDRDKRECELGYDMLPEYWKRGYMTEALNAILDFADKNMNLERIVAHIAEGNVNSERTAERQGFAFGGETFTLSFRGRDYVHRVYVLDIANAK